MDNRSRKRDEVSVQLPADKRVCSLSTEYRPGSSNSSVQTQINSASGSPDCEMEATSSSASVYGRSEAEIEVEEEEDSDDMDDAEERHEGYQDYYRRRSSVDQGKIKNIAASLKEEAGPSSQLAGLTELCEVLSFSMEELPGSSSELLAPVLVVLAKQEDNPDIMLLSIRCITYLCDVVPRSSWILVRHDVIPVLCAQLIAIEYLDVAEQCLQALEKISRDHPLACLQAGVIMSALNYVDFFCTSIQRVALSTVANICKRLPSDPTPQLMEAVPILCNLLQYEDQKLVENVSNCLIKIVDRAKHSSEMLDEICKHGLINQATHLIALNGRSTLNQSVYTGLIGLLCTLASGSVAAVRTLLELNIGSTLKHILSSYELARGMPYFVAGGEPCNQVHEFMKLLNELLPPLTKNSEDAPGPSDKEKILVDQPELLQQFGANTLPVLIQVASSGVNLYVCYCCLSVISKVIYFSRRDMLIEFLKDTNISSFLGVTFTRKDHHVQILVLEIVENIMRKLPDVFLNSFIKEGVVYAIDALLIPKNSSESASTQISSGSNQNSAKKNVVKCLCYAFAIKQSPSSTVTCKLEENCVHTFAERLKDSYFATDSHNSEIGLTETLQKLRSLCTLLIDKCDLSMTAGICFQQEENLSCIMNEIMMVLTAGEYMSTFEFIESGIVKSLVTYLSKGKVDSHGSGSSSSVLLKRLGTLARFSLLPTGESWESVPIAVLVRKLQRALSSLEDFSVILSHVPKSRNTYATIPFGRSTAVPSLKVHFAREEGEMDLCDYATAVVTVEPFSTLDDIETFLLPKVSTQKAEHCVKVVHQSTDTPKDLPAEAPSTPPSSTLVEDQNLPKDLPAEGPFTPPYTPPADDPNLSSDMTDLQEDKQNLSSPTSEGVVDVMQTIPSESDIYLGQTPASPRAEDSANVASSSKDYDVSSKLMFYLNGKQMDRQLTLYQAILQQKGKEEHEVVVGPGFWSEVYQITYRKSTKPKISSQTSSACDNHDLFGKMINMLVSELGCGLEKSDPTYEILFLLKILDGVNKFAFDLISHEERLAQESDDLVMVPARIPPTEFVNVKLTEKLEQQMRDPLSVSTGSMPWWCCQLMMTCPFLFGFEAKCKYFRQVMFSSLQAQPHLLARSVNSNNSVSPTHRNGGLRRKKFQVCRSNILDSATKMMEQHAHEKATVEVEYSEEVGSGLGPTMEFYTLVSHEFQKLGLGMWRGDYTSMIGDSGLVLAPLGVFPRPLSHPLKAVEVMKKFVLLGQIVAKAIQDGRVLDLVFSKAFYKLILDQELNIYDIRTIDPELGRTLLEFQALANKKKVSNFRDTRVEDLWLDFTLPGYPDYVLSSGDQHKMVNFNNLEEYVSSIVDATVISGVSRQMEAFKSGFNQVFPIKNLQIFTEGELERLLCGEQDAWTSKELLEHIKFDHGYTSSSQPIVNLLEIIQDFDYDKKRAFLQFVTGAPRLPPGGLAALNPQLTVVRKHCNEWVDGDLPSVMTCANYLKLPPYSSKVHEFMKLLNELLPPLTKNSEDAPGPSDKEKILVDQPELLQQFGANTLPVLIQVASSGVNLYVCYCCLSVISKVIYFSRRDMLIEFLKDTNISSFLAVTFTRKDHHVQILVLEIVENIMRKLPDVFLNSFIKEGVVYAIDALLIPKNSSESASTQISSGSNQNSAKKNVVKCLCYAFAIKQSPSSTVTCKLEENCVHTFAERLKDSYFATDSHNSEIGLTETLQKLRSLCTLLIDKCDLSMTAGICFQQEENLSCIMNEIMMVLTAGEYMSTFEFIESGIVKSLVTYLSKGKVDSHGSGSSSSVLLKRLGTLARFSLLPTGESWESVPIAVLVRKLQRALSSLEDFSVILSHVPKSRNTYATIPFGRSTAVPSLKVHFAREEGEMDLCDYATAVVTVEPFSTLDDIETFLLPKVSTQKAEHCVKVVHQSTDTPKDLPAEAPSTPPSSTLVEDQNLPKDLPAEGPFTPPYTPPADDPNLSSDMTDLQQEDKQNLSSPTSEGVVDVMQTIPSESDIYLGQTPASPRAEDSANVASSSKDYDVSSKLMFYLNGKQMDRQLTLYQAILQQKGKEEHEVVVGPGFWSEVYQITYRKSTKPKISSQTSSACDNHDLFGKMINMLVSELGCGLEKSDPTYEILFLLKILDGVNKFAFDLISHEERLAQESDDLVMVPARIPPTEFVNVKLTEKLEQQMRDPLSVSTGSMPWWCCQLMMTCPFLFGFEAKCKYFRQVMFSSLQAQPHLLARSVNSNNSVSPTHRNGGLRRKKFQVCRSNILDSATKMMEQHAHEKATVEVEYSEEVGSGLGPTMEFYTLVSHEFQKLGLGMWRGDYTSMIGDSGLVLAPLGVFPRPLSHPLKAVEVMKKFVLLGQIVAKAIQDGRVLDLVFSKAFYKLILDQELNIYDIRTIDPELGRTLLEFQALANKKKVSNFRDTRVEDLWLDFTLPGYPDYVLSSGDQHKMVNFNNLEEYVSSIVDATVISGVSRQMEAFKSGFNQVFPIKNLQIFTEGELERLLCGEQDAWTSKELLEHIKFDHGYTSSSQPIVNLLEIIQDFDYDKKRAFLQFVTGAPRLPPGGLAALNPQLTVVRKHCNEWVDGDLPSVMTCANYLKLPPYSSKVHEFMKLLNELLPPLTKNSEDAPGPSDKEKILVDQPELLQQFGANTLPVLIQVASSGVNLYVCYCCLSVISKVIYFSRRDMLIEFLKDTNISSFLAVTFTRKDHHVQILVLEIVENIMRKLPDVFLNSFIKEGVVYAIDALLIPKNSSESASTQISSGSNQNSAKKNVVKCLCYAFAIKQSPSSTVTCKLEENCVHTFAERLKDSYFATDSHNSEIGLTETLQKLRSLCTLLIDKCDLSMTAGICFQQEENLSCIMNEIMMVLTAGEYMSTFEFIESGIVKSLVTYLSKGKVDSHGSGSSSSVLLKRLGTLARFSLLPTGESWESVPIAVLVRKLQRALSSLEDFSVILSHVPKSRNTYATIPFGRSTAVPSLKVHFAREEGEMDLCDYATAVVTVEPFSTLDDIETFLLPKVSTQKAEHCVKVVHQSTDTPKDLPAEAPSTPPSSTLVEDQNLPKDLPAEGPFTPPYTPPADDPNLSSDMTDLQQEDKQNLSSPTSEGVVDVMQTIPSESDIYLGQTPASPRAEDSANVASSSKDYDVSSKLMFYLNGKQMDRQLTLYQAILQQKGKEEHEVVVGPGFWSEVYQITYRKSTKPKISSQTSSACDNHDLFGKMINMLVSELGCGLEKSDPTYEILFLLKILDGVNKFAFDLISHEERLAQESDDLVMVPARIPPTEFVNVKLTEKLEQQMRDPLSVSTGSMPWWCCQLMMTCPFLFGFEAKCKYFRQVMFSSLQAQPHLLARSVNSNNSVSPTHRNGGLRRKKFQVCRSNILDSATKMMEQHAHEKATVEVEYSEEVGSGLGPTMEFYTLVSHEFQKLGLGMWRGDYTSMIGDSGLVLAPLGVFPRPLSHPLKAVEVMKKFVLLGQIVAKAIQDGRVLDLVFSKAFYKLILDQELNIYDIRTIDPELGRTLLEFQALANKKKVSNFRDTRVEDLWLDFTLPGYPDYVLSSGDQHKMVNFNNLEEYVSSIVDATVISGVSRQMEAFKSGFNQVFPIKNLQIFTEGELERLLCGEQDAWTSKELLEHIKFDHGYTSSSQPIVNLLEIIQDFDYDKKRAFLQFVTGAPRLPPGGLAALNPQLTVVRKHCNEWVDGDLPSVMTCANYLKLPPYSSKVHEFMKLLNELLPPLTKNSEDAPGPSDKEKILVDQPELLQQFGANTLPVLIQVASSGVNLYVCYCCLSVISKVIYFSRRDMLIEFLKDTNISSFLAVTFTRKDHHVQILVLEIVENIMRKLPDVFLNSFIKEGVVYAIDALLIPKNSSESASTQISSGSNQNSAKKNVVKCLCYAFAIKQSPSSTVTCKLEENCVHTFAERLKDSYFATDSHNSEIGLTETLQKLRSLCTLLIDKCDLSMTAGICFQQEENLSCIMNEIMMVLTAGEYMSTFEFIESGIVKSLVTYLSKGKVDSHGSGSSSSVLLKRLGTLARFSLLPTGESWESVPIAVLVRKLQRALSSLEDFSVILSHVPKSRNTYATIPFGRSTAVPSLKVHFAREEGEMDLCDYATAVVTVEPFSTLDDIETFLLPKVSTQKAEHCVKVVHQSTDTPKDLPAEAPSTPPSSTLVEDQNLPKDLPAEGPFTPPYTPPADDPNLSSDMTDLQQEDKQNLSSPTSEGVVDVMQTIPSESDIYLGQTPASPRAEDSANVASSSKDYDVSSKLMFYLNGKQMDRQLTLYQAILQQKGKEEHEVVVGPGFWSEVYQITYRKSTKPKISSQTSSACDNHDLFGKMINMLVSELGCGLEKSDPTYEILFLLKILDGVNKFAFDLISHEERLAQESDDLVMVPARIPPTEFVNVKLTEKLEQQMRDPLSVSTGSMPWWCCQLMMTCPFLFGFEAKCKYFRQVMFSSLQAQPHLLARSVNSNNSVSPTHRNGGLRRKKFQVCRSNILDSATKMMEQHAHEKATVEVEYSEEVGSGLGPTMEFYTLVSHEFQKLGLGMWRGDYTSMIGDSGLVLAPLGVFPRPLSHPLKAVEVMKKFVLLGQIVAKAIQDGRVLDLVFSKAFYKLILDQELNIYDIRTIDPELGRTLLEFQALANKKKVSNFRDTRVEDLWLDFTLPGYPDYVLSSGDQHKMVNFNNLEEYVSSIVDATVISGVSRQMEAFKSGFNQVFPIKNLQIFTEGELERLLCGEQDAWTSKELLEHIKFDHGYTSSSQPIVNLLEIIQDFDYDKKRAFLQFVTGAPRLPPGGLAALNPQLTVVRKHCNEWVDGDLPSVMTCANYLKLPPYSSKERMRERLLYAITEGQGSFHLS